ncbi:SDR family oxidoreductase [Alkalihalophilus lindianensis]|uniref:SDR family oxidoreductase n=1 Tax=Alkalihalophilus lindianensis TaxID=1630542 RepID=A0ABU3XAQ5_9BACI|nr:SDR family oxidoreductase [Alkalihalophilus lindianensis]MDV2684972.1 SDR family oxidoreductase [Alkalihalophilus lindianensis]
MDIGLKGKSVIVLASSKGLGRACAELYVKEGAQVLLSSRNEVELENTVAEIEEATGVRPPYITCDISKPDDIKRLIETATALHGGIDVLINNAGGPPAGGFNAFEDADWQGAFELNLLSFIRAIRAVLPSMRERGAGRIVNIASSSIKEPVEGLILSNTFRTAIVGLSKSLAKELGGENILINTVGPGRIATDRVEALDHIRAAKLGLEYEEAKDQLTAAIPLGRYGTPDEFARTIVFLGSYANTYVTGQSMVVDGGATKAY